MYSCINVLQTTQHLVSSLLKHRDVVTQLLMYQVCFLMLCVCSVLQNFGYLYTKLKAAVKTKHQ